MAARFLHPWNFPGKNTRADSHSLLQGIFPTQETNLGLLRGRQILYYLSHQGSPLQAVWFLANSLNCFSHSFPLMQDKYNANKFLEIEGKNSLHKTGKGFMKSHGYIQGSIPWTQCPGGSHSVSFQDSLAELLPLGPCYYQGQVPRSSGSRHHLMVCSRAGRRRGRYLPCHPLAWKPGWEFWQELSCSPPGWGGLTPLL